MGSGGRGFESRHRHHQHEVTRVLASLKFATARGVEVRGCAYGEYVDRRRIYGSIVKGLKTTVLKTVRALVFYKKPLKCCGGSNPPAPAMVSGGHMGPPLQE